jgi:hypothetical protein
LTSENEEDVSLFSLTRHDEPSEIPPFLEGEFVEREGEANKKMIALF